MTEKSEIENTALEVVAKIKGFIVSSLKKVWEDRAARIVLELKSEFTENPERDKALVEMFCELTERPKSQVDEVARGFGIDPRKWEVKP